MKIAYCIMSFEKIVCDKWRMKYVFVWKAMD